MNNNGEEHNHQNHMNHSNHMYHDNHASHHHHSGHAQPSSWHNYVHKVKSPEWSVKSWGKTYKYNDYSDHYPLSAYASN
ncbi:hypothetical protein ScKU71_19650 [Streptococcus canis]|nr:hypothetical protein CRN29_11565 [Staphylococcus capitis]GMX40739.1 hypothetical protein ScKU71_19650 [Streptococcus canis]